VFLDLGRCRFTLHDRQSSISPTTAIDRKSRPESEWPTALLLDEIWLRVRRALVHELERSDLWPATQEHALFLQREQKRGRELADQLLWELLGPSDFAYLNSEASFGRANQRVRRRLPFVLAFGFDLGQGFCEISAADNYACQRAAELSALFNLGVSLFDLTYDEFPLQFDELGEVFDADMLTCLGADSMAARQAREQWQMLANEDIRVLLTIVAGFFERLHELRYTTHSQEDTDEVWSDLVASIHRAYAAELRSSTALTEPNREDVLEVARLKSTLPFQVISHVAVLAGNPVTPHLKKKVGQISDHIGHVFWLTDDLVDIVPDFQDGALNTFLIGEGGMQSTLLVDLLSSEAIEEASVDIAQNLGAALSVIAPLLGFGEEQRLTLPMSHVLLSFTRNWLE